jgi:hypothetical protein
MLLSKFRVAMQRDPYSDYGMFNTAVRSALKVQNDKQKAKEIADAVAKAKADSEAQAKASADATLMGRLFG